MDNFCTIKLSCFFDFLLFAVYEVPVVELCLLLQCVITFFTEIFVSTHTQLGGDVGVSNPQMEKMKSVMRIMAVAIIPFTGSFPSVSKHNEHETVILCG